MLQGHEIGLEQAGERLTNSWHDAEYVGPGPDLSECI